MQIISTIAEFQKWRRQVENVAFVPTMGNLHEGHLSLVREAKKNADAVVVSILVRGKILINIRAHYRKMLKSLKK